MYQEIDMIQELDSVVLTTDLPEYRLERGDIGTVVLLHRDGEGYEVAERSPTRGWCKARSSKGNTPAAEGILNE